MSEEQTALIVTSAAGQRLNKTSRVLAIKERFYDLGNKKPFCIRLPMTGSLQSHLLLKKVKPVNELEVRLIE